MIARLIHQLRIAVISIAVYSSRHYHSRSTVTPQGLLQFHKTTSPFTLFAILHTTLCLFTSHFQLKSTTIDLFVSFLAFLLDDMEAAFWHWAHNTPAAHLYGNYTSQHSFRLGLYHSREQLHSLQQTMYFDDSIYPHLPQPLLDRILWIRALVNHATVDLTAALGHIDAISQMSPRQLKGKGKGIPPVPSDPADDPITGTSQA